MQSAFSSGYMEEDLWETFMLLDGDHDGFISTIHIQEIYKKMGHLVSEEEALELIDECDFDKDGLIDFDGKVIRSFKPSRFS